MVYRSSRSHRKKLALVGFFFAATAMSKAAPAQHNVCEVLPYRDASLPVDERVDDLIQRMTLEEKAGQLF